MSETAVHGEAIEWESEDEDSDDSEEEEEYTSPSQQPPSSANFDKDRHLVYLEMMYELLPYHYQSQEINRLTLAHFIISGLHFLGATDRVDKDVVANWVLSFQAFPSNRASLKEGNFIDLTHNNSHLASTYCALAILKVIGHDLSTIDSGSLLLSMKNLQQDDGSFMPIHTGGETDLRFVYCAAAICDMLGDWSGMDKEKAKNYILNCQSYDGGFGLIPGSESHGHHWLTYGLLLSYAGGGTYCAIASLRLMGFIGADLLSNDSSGSILDPSLLLNWSLQYGGFSKFPGALPDLYHSYYGYTAFSFLEEPGLSPLCPELGLPLLTSTLGI
ncbi:hypothetical protein Bca101_041512 [Brassica carinata]